MLYFTTLFLSASAITAIRASPISLTDSTVHANITDNDVLNFALTLELLEKAFYTGALQNFSQDAFAAAGFAPPVREFYEQIAGHEQFHVDNLTTIIGSGAVQPCTYDFGALDVPGFVALSDTLEAVGASAYAGAAQYLQNKDFLTTAATILATEARHSSWINTAVRKANPWSTAYETPLDLNQVFTIASAFISSCPSSNTPLPVQANPQLSITSPADAQPGQLVTLSYAGQPADGTGLYAAFLSGIPPTFVPLDASFSAEIPTTLRGFAYLAITNSSERADDSVTVAGPAAFNFAFDSENNLVQLY
ncbi:ferritin-like domain-containing protein [Gloeopeniophorella convolvens]|nr:ferritin-like domain-containing protein [Gloeopeniophorella convolvens]